MWGSGNVSGPPVFVNDSKGCACIYKKIISWQCWQLCVRGGASVEIEAKYRIIKSVIHDC